MNEMSLLEIYKLQGSICRFHCNVCNTGKSRCGKTFV